MKVIKKFLTWLVEAVKETVNQLFTLLGFFIAWLTLTGSARDIVGAAVVWATIIWLITLSLRKDKE
jgi:hypothetical protein